ncbi:hypothetical protein EUGRSUZ_B01633 [Eucalyptus grandis]|uniref:Uncharacterized protein n=2 Tax=Eucalyptus grandis TaxID=71139 RepID=A0ACC3LR53_EUCGR|nr:hypothetical protein EUGRSUZ_B01633 [Eucalyptus grandis]
MHCTARLVGMLNQYYDELRNCPENDPRTNFLLEELEVLEEAEGIGLPNFLARTAFLTLLQRKVKAISSKPPSFGVRAWDYIEGVVIQELMRQSENYPQLQSWIRRAASNLINKMREQTTAKMKEIVEMEKLTSYTCNPEYLLEWNKLMAQQNLFMQVINDEYRSTTMVLEGIGQVDVRHLRNHKQLVQQAFDLKMRMTAYWKIVLRRFVDSMALHLPFSVHNLVNEEMEKDIVGELIRPNGSSNIERMLEEAPSVAVKREKLNNSVKLLRESAKVVARIMDRIAIDGDYTDS